MEPTQKRGRRLSRGRGLVIATSVALTLFPTTGSAAPQAPPSATGEPTISGRPIVGNILTASNGSFSGTGPFNYRYQWLRCPASGSGGNGQGCTAISGATFRRYTVRQADVGRRLRVRVTASNSEGSATATSNATAIVQAAPARPQNTAPPTIGGAPQVGQALTANNGTWTGQQPLTFTYQWRRCDRAGGSCSNISGATAKTYALTSADEGTTVRVRVTARNSAGTASDTSAPTAVVSKASAPSGSAISVNEVSLPNRLIVDRVSFSPRILRSRRPVRIRFRVSDSRQHPVQGALVFVVGIPFGNVTTPPEQATGPDGYVTFVVRPTRQLRLGRGSQPFFVRARKASDPLLGGVSTRRLVNLAIR
jgi:hypothetical protein